MTALTSHPIELQFVFKRWARHEAFQLCHPHVRNVFEDHMLADRFDGRIYFSARKTEPFHNRFGHFSADTIMSIETDASIFVHGSSYRFADVVKKDAKNERKRHVR